MTSPTATTEDVRLLTRIVRQKPEDVTAQMALTDAHMGGGLDRVQAELAVDLVVSESLVSRATHGRRGARIRTQVRQRCGVSSVSAIEVEIVSGDRADQPPRLTGEGPYHTFRDSDVVVHYPKSAMNAGKKLDYHPDTRHITVGVRWLRNLIEMGGVS